MKYLAGILAVVFVAGVTHGQFLNQDNEMPAFHQAPPVKGQALPPILSQAQLAESGLTLPAQKESYKAAAKVANVLYEQPCFCHCDRHAGHTSLRSCFEGTHGANCSTCMQEALYTYQMSKKGWTAKMIRDEIIRGDYRTVDLQNPTPVN